MKTCINHPGRKAYSICHGCGKNYCEECLTAGKEFYYCNNPECQKLLREEFNAGFQEEEITCPNCGTILELSEDEKKFRKVRCPECDAFLDVKKNHPKTLSNYYLR